MNNLFTLKFWLNLRPGSLSPFVFKAMAGYIFLLAITAFIFFLLKSKKQRLLYQIWSRLHLFSLANFVIGLFVLFFSYELIPFLSARFWILLWGLGMLAWLVYIGLGILKLPKIKKEIEKKNEFNKYLP